LLDFPKYV
jgi:hypothetical protein